MITARKDGLTVITLATQIASGTILYWLLGELFLEFTEKLHQEPPPLAIAIFALTLGLSVNYRKVRNSLPVRGDHKSLKSAYLTTYQTLIVAGALGLLLFTFEHDNISRSFIASFLGLFAISQYLTNRRFPQLIFRTCVRKNLKKSYLIIGNNKAIKDHADWIDDERRLYTHFVGYLDTDSEIAPQESEFFFPRVAGITDFSQIARETQPSHIVVLDITSIGDSLEELFVLSERLGCRLIIKNPLESITKRTLAHFESGNQLFFTSRKEPLENPLNRLVKRVFDISIALPVCALVLPPLFVWVKLSQNKQAPGPTLFKQRRFGRNREPFEILKFRSMYFEEDNSEEAEKRRALQQATKEDPRIYPFGALLRKTSLDEFPQFINVLLGDMSIVGPRPHPISLDQKYVEEIPAYASRHYVKPGITGLAQCNGFRGETPVISLMAQRVQHDIQYLEAWNPALDLYILMRTAKQLIKTPETAY